MFIGLVRDRATDAMPPQISADFAAAIAFVPHDATRTALRSPSPAAFHRTTGHQRFTFQGFMPLARPQFEAHPRGFVCRSQMHFGAKAPLAAAHGFGVGSSGRARCLLVGSNNRAVNRMNRPVDLPLGIGLLLYGRKEALPDAGFAPAVEAAGHRTPGALPVWQITPGGAGTQNPQHAVEEASMIHSGSTRCRFLGRKQRVEPFPLRVRQFFVLHTDECIPHNRVCKHALESDTPGKAGGLMSGTASKAVGFHYERLSPRNALVRLRAPVHECRHELVRAQSRRSKPPSPVPSSVRL